VANTTVRIKAVYKVATRNKMVYSQMLLLAPKNSPPISTPQFRGPKKNAAVPGTSSPRTRERKTECFMMGMKFMLELIG